MSIFRSSSLVVFLTVSLLTTNVFSQVQTPRSVTINSDCGGFYEYLPAGYNTVGKTFPLLIFIHGIGEKGNGSTADLVKLLRHGPPKLIKNGTFPVSFKVNNQQFSFIVISPQFSKWPTAEDVEDVVDYAIKNYKVDLKRIYVTGLSMGGGAVWDYASYNNACANKIAAILPISGASSPNKKKIAVIASSNLPVWALQNLKDPTVSSSYTINYVDGINAYVPKPAPAARKTIFNTSGHDAWTKTYNPEYRENGLNVYEWLLQFQRTPNMAPVANAGVDKIITLPTNSITLNGDGKDADGSIVGYSWSKITGPSKYKISDGSSASPIVNKLIEGTYVFRLTVTDNRGSTAYDDISVIVKPAPNQLPIANAGADQTIVLPQNRVTIKASAKDADGSVKSVNWSKLSGPSQFAISNTGNLTVVMYNLVEGTYVFRLTAKDNDGATSYDDVSIVVRPKPGKTPAPNKAPIANAGIDKTITLPSNSVTMTGSGTDADGKIASYSWSKISGPLQFSVSNLLLPNSVVSNLVVGTYVFRLTVKDNSGATAYDDVSIVVKPVPNKAPIANAGIDKTITLPSNSVTMTGSGADADGKIASYSWSKISGPVQFSVSNLSLPNSVVGNLVVGTYVFRLTVKDNSGATAYDDVSIVVKPAPNKAPIANAGTDKIITLPVNSVTMNGSGADADGSIMSYSWSKVSGPVQFASNNLSLSNAVVSNLIAGTYVFRLTVKDNSGTTAYDDVNIVVKPQPVKIPPANKAPVANAGTDKIITLPVNSVTMNGGGTDADGSITSYNWSKLSGPAQFSISSWSLPNAVVSSLVEGTYVFRLTVKDNGGATSYNDVSIIVKPAPNKAPIANAGLDKTITLPVNSVTMNGSGTDADGRITAYSWAKVAGPAQFSINNWSLPNAVVSNLVEGTYVFRLTVKDNDGATSYNDVNIAVKAPVVQVSKIIQVNVFGGLNPYNNTAWNNWNLAGANIAKGSGRFNYTDGTVSAVSAYINYSQDIADNSAYYGGGMEPDQVLRYASYSYMPRVLTISGLSPNKKYNLEFYASRNKPFNYTIFTIGQTSVKVYTHLNHSDKASFKAVLPDSKGIISIKLSNTYQYNYLNGFSITEDNSSASVVTRSVTQVIPETRVKDMKVLEDEAGSTSTGVTIYPNPVKDEFTLSLNNDQKGAMHIIITDGYGKPVKEVKTSKDLQAMQIKVPVSNLSAGAYFVTVQVGSWKETRKMLKL